LTDSPVVRAGTRGDAVRELQDRLRALRFELARDAAGDFGAATDAAVRAFQAVRGIRVDGVCGPETWAALHDSAFRFGDRLLCLRDPMVRGDDVAELQARLNALGFDAGKEDAILGPNTERALTEFQRNAGITADGICGPETIGALDRVGSRAGGAVTVVRERDALRDPVALAGRRVFVTATADLAPLAERIGIDLVTAGADAVVDFGEGESELAAAANRVDADLFLALRPRSAADGEPHQTVACRCCFFAAGAFQSETGGAIAAAIAASVGEVLGGTGASCGRAYTVLRETRMAAVVCEPVVEGDRDVLARIAAAPADVSEAVIRALQSVLERREP